MSGWVLYTRDGCSLCETFIHDLAALLGARADEVRLVDIAGDPALESRYGSKIPVLVIEGDLVCMYRLDPDRVRGYLTR